MKPNSEAVILKTGSKRGEPAPHYGVLLEREEHISSTFSLLFYKIDGA